MMAKITDRAFFDYLSANGVADVYSGYDGPTKLGWRKLFQQQQPSVQQGHSLIITIHDDIYTHCRINILL